MAQREGPLGTWAQPRVCSPPRSPTPQPHPAGCTLAGTASPGPARLCFCGRARTGRRARPGRRGGRRCRTEDGQARRAAPPHSLTCLRGLPPRLLDVLLRLVAQLYLQLLGLHLQVSLPLREGFPGLGSKDAKLFTGSEPGRAHGAHGAWSPLF